MWSEKSTTNALPKIIGYSFSELQQPHSYAKAHVFDVDRGVRTAKEVLPNTGLPPVAANMAPSERDLGVPRARILALHPQWKSLADKSLRFFGYFLERVDESQVERTRVRKVCLTFCLQDATISVVETPAVVNSGLREGTIMGRHWDPSLTLPALAVGATVKLRSRELHLVDCDAATRQFYRVLGMPQSEALEYPDDAYEQRTLAPRKVYDPEHVAMKRENEALAAAASGKVATFMTPAEREKAKNFFAHDREVLCFDATWDKRRFRLHYYISDKTIQVTCVHTANCGRDPNTVLIKRALVPKHSVVHKALDTVTARPAEHYTDEDLHVGATITIFARDFYLFDCDEFTRNFYAEFYGVDMQPVDKPETEGDPSLKRPQLARPRKPRNDYSMFTKHSGDVLRFAAQLASPAPEDKGREFIVCFYVSDNTVTVFEFTVRNSGHTGGKIFSRAPVPGVTREALTVGATVKLGGIQYFLKEMDERTRLFLEEGESADRETAGAQQQLLRLRDALNVRFSRTTEAYRHFNTQRCGIGLDDLTKMFKECELRLPDKETLMRVMDLVDLDRDGVISLQEFVENLLQQTLHHHRMPVAQNENVVRTYADVREEQNRRAESERVLKLFISKLEARRAFIVDTFRIVSDCAVDGLIGADAFREAVNGKLGMRLSESEMDALVFRFFFIPGLADYTARRLTLKDFRKVVEA